MYQNLNFRKTANKQQQKSLAELHEKLYILVNLSENECWKQLSRVGLIISKYLIM